MGVKSHLELRRHAKSVSKIGRLMHLLSRITDGFVFYHRLYFNHFSAKKNTYKFTYIKKTKMPREGQKQEQVPL